MTRPLPPETVYAGCVVREERYLTEGGEADRIIDKVYNGYGLLLESRRDFGGSRPDGVPERVYKYSYRQQRQRVSLVTLEGFPLIETYIVRDEYDSRERLVRRLFDENANGSVERVDRFGYDEYGNLQSSEFAGTTSKFERDDAGRILTELVSGIRLYKSHYIWENDLIIRIDTDEQDNGTIDSSIHFEYDDERRLSRATSPVVGEFRFQYSPEGWLSVHEYWIDDLREWVNTFAYDIAGRLTQHEYRDHSGSYELMRYANDCE